MSWFRRVMFPLNPVAYGYMVETNLDVALRLLEQKVSEKYIPLIPKQGSQRLQEWLRDRKHLFVYDKNMTESGCIYFARESDAVEFKLTFSDFSGEDEL